MICNRCGEEFNGKICPVCRTPAPQKTICQKCGSEYTGKFCSNCGKEYIGDIGEKCKNLYAKNGKHIDAQRLAGLYLSTGELERFFGVFTDYSQKEIQELSQYIYQYVEGLNFNFIQLFTERIKFESCYKIPDAPTYQAPPRNPSCFCGGGEEPDYPDENSFYSAKNEYRRKSKGDLRRQARSNGQACCPRCGSVSLSANKKGYGFIKGSIGAGLGAFIAPVGIVAGLAAGNIGGKRLWVTCLNCGHRWKV